MNPRAVEYLRRLIADGVIERRLGPLSQDLARDEGIGRINGARVLYTAIDHAKARNLLVSRGFDVQAPQQAYSRSDAPPGGSEKAGALRVSDDLVAVVTIGIPAILTPTGGMLALTSKVALALPYEVLLVCENLEPLLQLHAYGWLSEFLRGRAALAVFRGGPGYFRTDVVATLMRRDTRPTLAFFDFDPKGLSMAASVPRREALCLPPWEQLQAAVLKNHRTKLFVQSVDACRPHLDRGDHGPEIATAWVRLKELSKGLDQEHFPRQKNQSPPRLTLDGLGSMS